MSLPDIPALPQQPAPTLAERLHHAALLMHRADLEMRERHNTAAEQRNAALVAAHGRLAAAQERAATVGERTLDEGIPTDQPMVDAVNGLRAALEAWQPVPGEPTQPGAPAWAGDVRQALQTAAQALLAAAQAIPGE